MITHSSSSPYTAAAYLSQENTPPGPSLKRSSKQALCNIDADKGNILLSTTTSSPKSIQSKPKRSRVMPRQVVFANGTFELYEDETYDNYPDIKGYLCLLGTTTLNRVVWFYDSSQSDDELSPDDLAKKRETDAAVRRGVQLLIGLREKGEGMFVPVSDNVDPVWEAIPWVPASGLLGMTEEECNNLFYASKDPYVGEDASVVNSELVRCNIRFGLPSASTRPDLSGILPSDPQWIFLITTLYCYYSSLTLCVIDEMWLPGQEFDCQSVLIERDMNLWSRRDICDAVNENETTGIL